MQVPVQFLVSVQPPLPVAVPQARKERVKTMFLGSKGMLLLLMMIIPLIVGCGIQSNGSQRSGGGSQSPCDKVSSIKGSIQTVTAASGTTILLLDSTKEQQPISGKVSVLITSTTQIFEKHGQECRTVTSSALQAGQRVQIQTSGPATQSYPPQITATEVVILSGVGLGNPPV